MTQPRLRAPFLRAAGFGAAAVALTVAACETPGPVHPSPVSVQMAPARKESATGVVAMRSNVRISRAAIEAAVREHYPQVFRAAPTDRAHLLFVLDPEGRVVRHEQLRERTPAPGGHAEVRVTQGQPSRERRAAGDREIMDVIDFAPGQMGAGRVEVVWIRNLTDEELRATRVTTRERVPAGAAPKTSLADGELLPAKERGATAGAPARKRAGETRVRRQGVQP